MRKLSDKSRKLDSVLFDVDLRDVYIKDIRNAKSYRQLTNHKAVTALETQQVFSVVSTSYKLITNQQAIEYGKLCFKQIFKVTDAEDMELFRVLTPQTRSYCHIDFLHKSSSFSPFSGDDWKMYLRITNSYNRMYSLNFDIGFCRTICSNGMFLGKRNIEIKFPHIRGAKNPEVVFNLRSGELRNLETEFTESIHNLKRFHVPPKYMWAMTCKIFGIKALDELSSSQEELLNAKRNHIEALSKQYFDEIGHNGYAALNIVTDFASRPAGYVSPDNRVNSFQRKTGEWMADFISAIKHDSFTFENYLGEYAKLVA